MVEPRDILLTAFEPSGDALAAGLIAQLRLQRPQMKIWALGGPKMAAAGAELIETTTEHPVMLAGALGQAWAHRQRLKRLERWLASHPLAALVPTDSPAANWSICKLVRKRQPQARIVHLAAPQIWAWASWRIHKLRRLTDHVLCLLPFEPPWLGERGVVGTFVGHPIFEHGDPPPTLPAGSSIQGDLILALLPGSRRGELHKNWPTMLQAFVQLRRKYPQLAGYVAAVNRPARQWLTEASQGQEAGLHILEGRTDEIISRADVVLAVSGTVTLQVAWHRKPMAAMYNVSRLMWNLLGRWLVSARTFALPNIIAAADGRERLVREFIPHFGAVAPIVAELDRLLSDPAARAAQRARLEEVCVHFQDRPFGQLAAAKLLEVVEGRESSPKAGG